MYLNSLFLLQAKSIRNKKPLSFHKVSLKAFWPMLAVAGGLRFIADILAFVGPFCIEHIINYAYRTIKGQGSQPHRTGTTSVPYPTVSYNNVTAGPVLTLNMSTTEAPLVRLYMVVSSSVAYLHFTSVTC